METASWTFKSNKLNDSEYELVFTADIIPNYHMYSMNVSSGGPMPLKIVFEPGNGYELVEGIEARSPEHEEFDEIFEMDVKYFDSEAIVVQKVKLTADKAVIKGAVEYQTCGENQCFQGEDDFSFTLASGATQQSVVSPKAEDNSGEKSESLWMFFFIAFAAGLGGILTPCVFPMIPMTVSFFMSGSDKRVVGAIKGIIFGLSVTLIYTIIGVIVALTKNVGLADVLSNNWIPNLIFFLLFVIFAISFLGAFEITLPSSLANRADRQADRGGYIASFFLAIVLAIVSFSCTGPFVGAILVEAAQGGLALKPIVGMFGFGLALSLPFVILAFFPSMVKKLPKSGGWLNSVKVVFAFILLAFGMKFLTVVDTDLELNVITRDVFIAIWIVLFILLGLYLLGKIKFSHDSDLQHVGVFRLFVVIVSFSFAVYLIPGLFGAPLAAISGFMPAQDKQVFDLTKSSEVLTMIPAKNYQIGSVPQISSNKLYGTPKYADFLHLPTGIQGYFDLKEGLACAKQQNKLVLLDFKGHRCANCKKMDKEVFTDQRVIEYINKNFTVIGLYVDDETELPQSEWVKGMDGKDKKTIGKINREYQMSKFKQASQPYFAITDSDENILIDGVGYMSNPDKFLEWLKKGVAVFQSK
jgi:thiol:disulfide interchange protein DsbD